MDKKELIITGVIIIIIIAAVLANSFIFNPNTQEVSKINILNNNTLGENGTLYVKLTDINDVSLSDETIHIIVTDENNTQIYNTTTKTHFTGVAVVKLDNLSNGTYNVNASFEGDDNYTASSAVQEITIGEGYVEEDLTNITEIAEENTLTEDNTQTSPSSQSSQSSYSSQSSSSSSSISHKSTSTSTQDSGSDSEGGYYDENGKSIEPTIDENGKETLSD